MHRPALRLDVSIDRESVLGHIGIVESVVLYALLPGLFAQQPHVLAKAVPEHTRSGAGSEFGIDRARRSRCTRRCTGILQIKAHEPAMQCAVPEFMRAVAAQSQ